MNLKEALYKQHTLDRIEEENSVKPMKEAYRKDLIKKIEAGEYETLDSIIDYNLDPDEESLLGSVKSSWAKFRK